MPYFPLLRFVGSRGRLGVVFLGFLISVLPLTLTAQNIIGKVVGIKDGDTIELLVGQTTIKVRLYGIDCPEKKQDFGNQATKFVSILCFQKNVIVEPHGNDKYRRLLGVVMLKDGTNVNQKMVEAGYAWRYKYSTDKSLLKLQQQAQAKKVGLWVMPAAVAPWEFRKTKHPHE